MLRVPQSCDRIAQSGIDPSILRSLLALLATLLNGSTPGGFLLPMVGHLCG